MLPTKNNEQWFFPTMIWIEWQFSKNCWTTCKVHEIARQNMPDIQQRQKERRLLSRVIQESSWDKKITKKNVWLCIFHFIEIKVLSCLDFETHVSCPWGPYDAHITKMSRPKFRSLSSDDRYGEEKLIRNISLKISLDVAFSWVIEPLRGLSSRITINLHGKCSYSREWESLQFRKSP